MFVFFFFKIFELEKVKKKPEFLLFFFNMICYYEKKIVNKVANLGYRLDLHRGLTIYI